MDLKIFRTREKFNLGFRLNGGVEGYEEAYLELQSIGAGIDVKDQQWSIRPAGELK